MSCRLVAQVLAYIGWLFVDVFANLCLGFTYPAALSRSGSWAIDSEHPGLALLVDKEAFVGRES